MAKRAPRPMTLGVDQTCESVPIQSPTTQRREDEKQNEIKIAAGPDGEENPEENGGVIRKRARRAHSIIRQFSSIIEQHANAEKEYSSRNLKIQSKGCAHGHNQSDKSITKASDKSSASDIPKKVIVQPLFSPSSSDGEMTSSKENESAPSKTVEKQRDAGKESGEKENCGSSEKTYEELLSERLQKRKLAKQKRSECGDTDSVDFGDDLSGSADPVQQNAIDLSEEARVIDSDLDNNGENMGITCDPEAARSFEDLLNDRLQKRKREKHLQRGNDRAESIHFDGETGQRIEISSKKIGTESLLGGEAGEVSAPAERHGVNSVYFDGETGEMITVRTASPNSEEYLDQPSNRAESVYFDGETGEMITVQTASHGTQDQKRAESEEKSFEELLNERLQKRKKAKNTQVSRAESILFDGETGLPIEAKFASKEPLYFDGETEDIKNAVASERPKAESIYFDGETGLPIRKGFSAAEGKENGSLPEEGEYIFDGETGERVFVKKKKESLYFDGETGERLYAKERGKVISVYFDGETGKPLQRASIAEVAVPAETEYVVDSEVGQKIFVKPELRGGVVSIYFDGDTGLPVVKGGGSIRFDGQTGMRIVKATKESVRSSSEETLKTGNGGSCKEAVADETPFEDMLAKRLADRKRKRMKNKQKG
eukprot:TRINITY_DN9551_c0_g1_i2.p1 TRINITY_DN9551_c0_g1~~TRINITY_DN9551_c0_g1_i2.p1  ORF type:complete len:659 (-),score=144.12 TRINITY_DN9551_c0_g1_i2:23-1999(-)